MIRATQAMLAAKEGMNMRYVREQHVRGARRGTQVIALRWALVALSVFYLSACSLPFSTPEHGASTKPVPTHTPQPEHPLHYLTTQHTVYALDTVTGALRWQVRIESQPYVWVVAPKTIFVASSGTNSVTALRATDGSTLWQRDFHGSLFKLTADDNVALFYEYGQRVFAVNAATGVDQWSWKTTFDVRKGVILGDSVLLSADHQYNIQCPGDGSLGSHSTSDLSVLQALNLRDGSERWHVTRRHEIGVNIEAVDEGIIYGTTFNGERAVCGDALPSHLFAANLASGALLWTYDDSHNLSHCYIASHTLYCGSDTGVKAFRGTDGHLLWRYGVARFEIYAIASHALYVSPIPINSTAPLPGPSFLALDATSGAPLWSLNASVEQFGHFRVVAASDGFVYGIEANFEGAPWHIVALDERTEVIKWIAGPYSGFYPELSDGAVFVHNAYVNNATIYGDVTVIALNGDTGAELWRRLLPKDY
jgi:outer membrane protein assembly factor BamB